METAVEMFAAVNFVIIGLSHITQPTAWAEFFVWLRERGHAGVFVNGFISLGFGSIVVAFHNVWTGIPAILTVYGWLLILKALIAFTLPSYAMKSLQLVNPGNAKKFAVAGFGLLVLGGLLIYSVAG